MIWRALRDGLSRLRRLAGSRLSPTGFNPSRECNALTDIEGVCPRHGHSHRMTEQEERDLAKLLTSAQAGRSGVNLAKMSDEEIVRRLSRQRGQEQIKGEQK